MINVHTKDWYRKVHTATWYCDRDEHLEQEEFNKEVSWKTHMQTHPNPPTELQLKVLSIQNRQRAERAEYHCLFCENIPEVVAERLSHKDPSSAFEKLMMHIGNHVKSLSLIALPTHFDDDKNSSISEDSKSSDSSTELLGGANSLEDVSLRFDDPPDRQRVTSPGRESFFFSSETKIDVPTGDIHPGENPEDDSYQSPEDDGFFDGVGANELDWGFVWEKIPRFVEPKLKPSHDPILKYWGQTPKIVTAGSITMQCVEALDIDILHNPRYLPQDERSDFLNPRRVGVTIRHHFRSLDAKEENKLFHYSIKNPWVFLTLAVTKLIKKMPLLRSGHFTDRNLPVQWERNKEAEGGMIVYSVADVKKSPLRCFALGDDENKNWDWPDIEMFVWKQWTFFAVVFEDNCFRHQIHHERPLPYVELPQDMGRGYFGKVFKLGLRAEHIRSNFGRYFPQVRQMPISSHKP